MKELVFLVEGDAECAFLENLTPRLLHPEITMRCIPFEGKQDLEKQLTMKLRAYRNPHARFIVIRDQDSHPDCKALKSALQKHCESAGKAHATLIRIACRELEAFYLGDLAAVETGLGMKGLAKKQGLEKFRKPDNLGSPSRELSLITKGRYQKVGGSRSIARALDLDNLRSTSFHHLISGIRRIQQELINLPA